MNRHPYELKHVPTGIILQVHRADLGHPNLPDLWDELRNQPIRPGELQCLYCLDEGHGVRWVHLVDRQGTRFPRHFDASIRDHVDMSAEHRALVDRVGRDVEARDSSLRFGTEVRSLDGAWIADGLVTRGGKPKVDFEAQLSPMGTKRALLRDRPRRATGVHTVWTPRNDRAPWCRGLIPSAVIPNLEAAYLSAGNPIPVRGGIRYVVEERCGRGRPCPDKRPGCTRMHLQLDVPGEATKTIDYAGRRSPELGWLVADLALGAWDTITDRFGNWMFTPTDHAHRWRSEVGETARTERQREERIRASANHQYVPAAKPEAVPATPGRAVELDLRFRSDGTCGSGNPLCSQPARLYPAGWRCDQHRPHTLTYSDPRSRT